MRSFFRTRFPLLILCTFLAGSAASAQTAKGPDLGAFVNGTFGDGGPGASLGVTAGYRFTSLLSAELKASYLPRLDFGEIPLCPPGLFCIAANAPATFRAGSYAVRGRSRSLTLAVISELPVRFGPVRPYVAAGGGLANVRRELRDTEVPSALARTSTDPMMTLGGGVEVPLRRSLMLGIDVRHERTFGEDQFDRADVETDVALTTVGMSVRYRF